MNLKKHTSKLLIAASSFFLAFPTLSFADCGDLPNHATLTTALQDSIAPNVSNGGFDLPMWATIVDRSGIVCAVAKSGNEGDQWPGSRVISAQKANTANAFSLPGLAISTANLWAATQPGGSLFGLQFSNPVNPVIAYDGDLSDYGTAGDQLVGEQVGGVNVFGGGLALYDESGELLGAVGVSGDSSCADHNIAWRVRDELELDNVPAGPGGIFGGTVGDNIIYDITGNHGNFASKSGFGHPGCGGNEESVNEDILEDHPLGPNP